MGRKVIIRFTRNPVGAVRWRWRLWVSWKGRWRTVVLEYYGGDSQARVDS